jgi:hypothetical protein
MFKVGWLAGVRLFRSAMARVTTANRLAGWLLALAGLFGTFIVGAGAVAAQTPPVQLVLKLKPEAGLSVEQGRFVAPEAARSAATGQSATKLNELVARPLVTQVRPLFSGGQQGRGDVQPNLARYYAIKLKPGATPEEVEQLRSRLASQDIIEQVYVAPVPENPASGSVPGGGDPALPGGTRN